MSPEKLQNISDENLVNKDHNNTKKGLEKSAVEDFLKWYNTKNNTKLSIIKVGDRPDIILSNGIGVEVAHIFPNDKCAKVILTPTQKGASYTNSDFIYEFNRVITKKCKKIPTYNYDGNIFLLIRVGINFFTQEDFQRIRSKIKIANNCCFKIYVSFCNMNVNKWCDVIKLR